MLNNKIKYNLTESMKSLVLFVCLIAYPLLIHAQSAETCFIKGMDKMTLRDFDSAEYFFNKAIEIDPEFAEAFFRRGISREKAGRIMEAFDDYSFAISIHPQAKYYNNRGIIRFVQGDNLTAISDYDSAIVLDPEYLIAVYNKGRAYLEINEFKDGCDCMKEAYNRGLSVVKDAIDYYCN